AIERGLVAARDGETPVSIFMENTGQVAVATVQTPGGAVTYEGGARIDGVPGSHAPVPLEFRDTAGSSCGALLPSGNAVDVINGVPVTLIDNGMPCVVMKAADVGITGYEDRDTLDADTKLKAKVEAIRLAVGAKMNLGDVTEKSVPKMMLVARPKNGGAVTVRSFIPHRAHATIGVLGAVSVATACLIPGSPAAQVADIPDGPRKTLSVEHPTGEMSCVLELDAAGQVVSAALLRTARKLMDGVVFG
ncbi:MAG: 4-oxalomesaconate tautomerase, partial [Alphaproteobacteria bacterium]|nr:4-oxalomesaconate tautomerase [Alphaproteobacteria bacterium]